MKARTIYMRTRTIVVDGEPIEVIDTASLLLATTYATRNMDDKKLRRMTSKKEAKLRARFPDMDMEEAKQEAYLSTLEDFCGITFVHPT